MTIPCFLCNNIIHKLNTENNDLIENENKLLNEKHNLEMINKSYENIILNFFFNNINSNIDKNITIKSQKEYEIYNEIVNLFNYYIYNIKNCKYAFEEITYNMIFDIFHRENNDEIYYKKLLLKKSEIKDNYLLTYDVKDYNTKENIELPPTKTIELSKKNEYKYSDEHLCHELIENCNNNLDLVQNNIDILLEYNNDYKNKNYILRSLIKSLINKKIELYRRYFIVNEEIYLFRFIWGREKINKKTQINLLKEILLEFNGIQFIVKNHDTKIKYCL